MSEDTTPARGMLCQVRTCGRCLRVLAPSSGDDCPDHTLPCCGGKGAMHARGCAQDPAFLAGVEYAREVRAAAAVNKPLG